jgi:hypothetical protein
VKRAQLQIKEQERPSLSYNKDVAPLLRREEAAPIARRESVSARRRLFGTEEQEAEEFGSPSFGVKGRRQVQADKHNFKREEKREEPADFTFDERFRLEVQREVQRQLQLRR